MRCACCNKRLTDYEATRKVNGQYLDECSTCLKVIQDISEESYGEPAYLRIDDRPDLWACEHDVLDDSVDIEDCWDKTTDDLTDE